MANLTNFLPHHVATYGETSAKAECKARFSKVQNSDHWKGPISAVAGQRLTRDEAESEARLVSEAVVFFVGEAEVKVLPEFGRETFAVVVKSRGYWAVIGG